MQTSGNQNQMNLFKRLQNPGDQIVVENLDRELLREYCSQNKLMVKVMAMEAAGKSLVQLIKTSVNKQTVKFPELHQLEVGDSVSYDYEDQPFQGSYFPRGLMSAITREKKLGKNFEWSAAHATTLTVLRIS